MLMLPSRIRGRAPCSCLRLAGAMALFALSISPALSHAQPDPVALLRGVESTRSAIRSGRLACNVEKQHWWPIQQSDAFQLEVTFDGARRRCAQRGRNVVINPGASPAKLAQMKNDRDAFVAAGHGKWREDHIRSIWDGNNFSQYGESLGASFRSHSGGTPEFVIDPRLLGLIDSHFVLATLADSLPYRVAKTISVVGDERVDGHLCWHVRLIYPDKIEHHYWIEDQEEFRVHRAVNNDGFRTITIESHYDASVVKQLPVRETTREVREGRVVNEVIITVNEATLGVEIAPSTFTWASMGMPAGEAVSDERIGRRLGYWDGEKVVEDYGEAIKTGRQLQQRADRQKWYGNIGRVFAGVVVALAAGLLAMRFWRRAAR